MFMLPTMIDPEYSFQEFKNKINKTLEENHQYLPAIGMTLGISHATYLRFFPKKFSITTQTFHCAACKVSNSIRRIEHFKDFHGLDPKHEFGKATFYKAINGYFIGYILEYLHHCAHHHSNKD